MIREAQLLVALGADLNGFFRYRRLGESHVLIKNYGGLDGKKFK